MESKTIVKLVLSLGLLAASSEARAQSACTNSSTVWQNAAFPALAVPFTAVFDVIPGTVNMDGVVGLSNGAAADFSDLAAIVRFNNQGRIDVRNGSAYEADATVPYEAMSRYRIRMAVDPVMRRYTVYVTAPGSGERVIATRYSFRTEQAGTSSFNNRGLASSLGSLQVCGFTVTADGGTADPGTGTGTGTSLTATASWQNMPFASQTGSFNAAFDVTPGGAAIDGVFGLSKGAATGYTGLAAIVRFNTQGLVDARNGGVYSAATSFRYTSGVKYRVRISANVLTRRYNAYVTPPGGGEILIGSSYAFRTEQASVTSLDNLGLVAASGSALVSSPAITPDTPADTTAPSVSMTAPAAGSNVSGTVSVSATASDNVGVSGVQFLLDGAPLGAEVTAAPFATTWNAASAAIGSHTLAAVARDAAGNKTTSASITVTVGDVGAPTVSITAPSAGATVSGQVTVAANASDNVGVAGVQFMLDGAPLGAEDTAAPYSTAWNTAGRANGAATLTAIARDTSGNKSTSPAVAVTVSNTVVSGSYNTTIMNDRPVLFLAMDTPGTGKQNDLSGRNNNGTYTGGTPGVTTLPNGENAAVFNGTGQYLTVPSNRAYSVPTTGVITIESWIKPSVLNFPRTEAEGYVYFLGKGNPSDGYEYANRMYSQNTSRPNRISDYQWNVSGGLGSGAYFQDTVRTSEWIMVTDVINMRDRSSSYPTGYISIYKNGVLRGKVRLDQYNVTPGTTNSPFNVGTRNNNSYFQGAIGKVAVWDYELTAAQIQRHYQAMTSGSSVAGAGVMSLQSSDAAQTVVTGAEEEDSDPTAEGLTLGDSDPMDAAIPAEPNKG